MPELKCKHCGREMDYAGAHIINVRGETCPENVKTWTDNGWAAKRELEHDWTQA